MKFFFALTLLSSSLCCSEEMTMDDFYEIVKENCQDIGSIRVEMDRINNGLLQLLAERTAYVKRAGDLKSRTTKIADDRARVADQERKIIDKSIELKLPIEISVPSFRTIMETSIQFQQGYIDKLTDKMKRTNFKNVAEEYAYRVWGIQDLNAIDELMHSKVIIHSLLGDYEGSGQMKTVVQSWLVAFPDLVVTNKAVISENDRTVIQWNAEGTHLGEFKGIPPTGKRVLYEGVTIYKMDNNKITEYWAYLDMTHLLDQIRP